jgi:hypothetical protein
MLGCVRLLVGVDSGDTALVEDVDGDGHSTKNLSDEPLTLSVTQL